MEHLFQGTYCKKLDSNSFSTIQNFTLSWIKKLTKTPNTNTNMEQEMAKVPLSLGMSKI